MANEETGPKTVVVLGVARSGTSMASGLLHFLGVNMSPSNNPGFQNPKGSFEDIAFIKITTDIARTINQKTYDKTAKRKFLTQLKEVIKNREDRCRQQKNRAWGWKSALTHHAMELMHPLLHSPYLIIVFRNPLDNARSWKLHKRLNYGENVTIEKALSVVSDNVQDIVSVAKRFSDIPRHYTTYEQIKSRPVQEAKKMAQFLELECGEDVQEKVREFIMPNYSTLTQKPPQKDAT